MVNRLEWASTLCSITRGIGVLGDAWTLHILREILAGARYFGQIRDALDIANNILSGHLQRMAAAGLITHRTTTVDGRPRKEYLPIAAAVDALPILNALSLWAQRHASDEVTTVTAIVCLECSTISTAGERCSNCNALLSAGGSR